MPGAPVSEYRTPVINGDGADLASLFPTIIPAVEKVVYERVLDACNSRLIFPTDGSGLQLPAAFSLPPMIGLRDGQDSTYGVPPIRVVRGWVAYPGELPSIGVAESTSNDDPGEDTIYGGFAGDVYATDALGNVIGSCAYYAEPMTLTVVVELIHDNRDERDRLHDQLRRVLWPLKHQASRLSSQIRGVVVDAEKQDLPTDELPRTLYASVFTLTASCEALIPTEITPVGVITDGTVDVTASIAASAVAVPQPS